jgi:tetratricopeptide (TPR) repeat protein
MKIALCCLCVMFSSLLSGTKPDKRLLTVEDWLEDLAFVTAKLESQHPDLHYKVGKARFDSVVAVCRREIVQSHSDLECYFAIKRTIAAVEDGHTGLLEDGIFNLLDLRFPFRADEFTDGVFITLIEKENERVLGSRITAVNGKPIENVLETIEEVASSDNRFGRRYWALNGLSFARILNGLKIIDDTNTVTLELVCGDGKAAKLTLRSRDDDSALEYGWSNEFNVGPTEGDYVGPAEMLGEKKPLYFTHQGKRLQYYWFKHLPEEKAIYFQFNQIANQDTGKESFAQFSARMWDYIDHHLGNIDKLIIDLRHDNGGNAVLILPFLNQIIKRDYLNREGGLYVISSKRTYSAASIFMNELAIHTKVRFLGEPDACGSDLFSNSRLVGRLPHSGFPLWIATLHFTNRWPGSNTEYFMPDFPAPFSSRDYFNGRDPALDLALRGDCRSVAEYAADEGASAAFLHYGQLKEKYGNIDWWTVLKPEKLESNVNGKGYDLMSQGELKRALQVLKLNTLLFPDSANTWDSLAECHFNLKEYDLSVQYYEKSLELDPGNENGKKMIERITSAQGKK